MKEELPFSPERQPSLGLPPRPRTAKDENIAAKMIGNAKKKREIII
jgi:hypothetical protein